MDRVIAQRYNHLELLPRPEHYRAMSTLYKAFDTQEKQWVVVKTMTEEPDDPHLDQKKRKMFEREIEIAITLNHEYILRVNDYGNLARPKDRESFLVYPYMQDGSLWDILHKSSAWKHWSLMQTVDIIQQAASALIYMHRREQPIVHWDVKDENFLVRMEIGTTRIAHLFLCDFGISHLQRARHDQTSQPWGTPNFMPPEQWNAQITCQSDQYALAMLACYLLTGKYPLEAKHPEDWRHVHLSDPPKRPSELSAQRVQSHEIDDVILKALSKSPDERFSDIWVFAKELYNAVKRQEANKYAETVPVQHFPSTADVPGPRPDPVALHPPFDTGAYQIEIELPVVQQPQLVHPPKSTWSALPFISPKLLQEYQLPATPNSLCWSPNGNALACLFLEHSPIILSRDGTKKVMSIVKTGHVASWSPYDNTLAISSEKRQAKKQAEIYVVNTNSLALWPLIISSRASSIDGLDWSVRGQLAVWASGENQIRVYDMTKKDISAASEPRPQFIISTRDMLCSGIGVLRWSPDGSLLAAGGKNGTVMCWQGGKLASQWSSPTSQEPIHSLSWSLDNTSLAITFRNKRQIMIWNVSTSRIDLLWDNLPVVPLGLSISKAWILAVASNKEYLLVGKVDQHIPSAKLRGTTLVTWSPTRSELATIAAPEEDTKLLIWANVRSEALHT